MERARGRNAQALWICVKRGERWEHPKLQGSCLDCTNKNKKKIVFSSILFFNSSEMQARYIMQGPVGTTLPSTGRERTLTSSPTFTCPPFPPHSSPTYPKPIPPPHPQVPKQLPLKKHHHHYHQHINHLNHLTSPQPPHQHINHLTYPNQPPPKHQNEHPLPPSPPLRHLRHLHPLQLLRRLLPRPGPSHPPHSPLPPPH